MDQETVKQMREEALKKSGEVMEKATGVKPSQLDHVMKFAHDKVRGLHPAIKEEAIAFGVPPESADVLVSAAVTLACMSEGAELVGNFCNSIGEVLSKADDFRNNCLESFLADQEDDDDTPDEKPQEQGEEKAG